MIPPNFGEDLRRIHIAITRGVQVSAEAADIYAHEGFPDEAMRRGFHLYVDALVALLDAHHAGERDIAWPFLREHMPHVTYDMLTEDHFGIEDTFRQIANARAAEDTRVYLYLARLQDQWDEHRSREELAFSPEATAAAMDTEHHLWLTQQLMEHVQAHAQPSETVIPFLLYNLPPHARDITVQFLPPAVVREMIPGPWLATWGPMRPFLNMES